MTYALYNEIEPYAVAWLRNLVAAGHIAQGDVDERSIRDLQPADLAGRVQCHFFAGIGVWSYALRLAGWPDDAAVWTGSCPCQPFSGAGRRRGFDDERHLWPEWFRLIRECRPPVVFGEQVASPDGLGWFDAVSADLEGEGYAVGAADLGAASVGAPHIRQRLYFVAVADGLEGRLHVSRGTSRRADVEAGRGREARELADLPGCGRREGREATGRDGAGLADHGCAGIVGDAYGTRSGRDGRAVLGAQDGGEGEGCGTGGLADEPVASGAVDELGDSECSGLARRTGERRDDGAEREAAQRAGGATGGFWTDADWLPCRDGKARPVEPGTFPLAHRTAGRVGKLRAYGNAIVPQVAATFIRAVMEVLS